MALLQIFSLILAIYTITGAWGYPGYDEPIHGYGGGYDIKYPPQPYGFGYEIKDHLGNQQYRKEHSDGLKSEPMSLEQPIRILPMSGYSLLLTMDLLGIITKMNLNYVPRYYFK
ncbi:hypothetical protein NPIL_633071 [Nephila pilipes]|uniref:Spider venom protein n=1 Tax=Nephila pilipes TaxID=299642 RepID=A0A8X6Q2R5_NEPPI|nr:hypothetical protein NPIL_633071 [Nephila pilipes]